MVRVAVEKLPQAERAVRNFNRMLPTLDGFARALTGKNLRVKIGERTMTDGKTIYIMPPYSLGNEVEHERTLCDKRDEDGRPMCEACFVREDVLVQLYHEISHNAFGSFAKVNGSELSRAINQLDIAPDARERIVAKIDRKSSRAGVALSMPEYAGAVNPFLPVILNAFEDVRVDSRMHEVRPGTAIMQFAEKTRVMRDGFRGVDGSVMMWQDADLNSQLVVAMMLKSVGFDATEAMKEFVNAVCEDKVISKILVKTAASTTQIATMACAVEVLVRAQEFGFFQSDNPDENYQPEPETEEKDDDETTEDGEPESDGDDADSDGAGESDDEAADPAGGDPEASDADADSAGDASPVDGDSDEPGDGGEGEVEEGSDGSDSEPSEEGEPSGEPGGSGGSGSSSDKSDGDSGEGEGAGEPEEADGDAGSGDRERGELSDSADSSGAGADGESDAVGTGEESEADGTQEAREGGASDGSRGGNAGTEVLGDDDPDSDPAESPEGAETGSTPDPRELMPEDANFGDHHEVERALAEAIGHDSDLETITESPRERNENETAIEAAATYVEHFDAPSRNIRTVRILEDKRIDVRTSFNVQDGVDETILGPALLHMRRVFTDNQRGGIARNKRSGRVNARVLGRRAWSDDDRLFVKKSQPGKKDYAVLIGVDVSGSTRANVGAGLQMYQFELRAAYAQAELCHRLGIKFSVYAHSGDSSSMLIIPVKTWDQPWNSAAIARMNNVHPHQANLDGHTIEYYRKQLDQINATHKILMYYSDGQMPAENYAEELEILKREVQVARKKNYILMSVGARTSDPQRHGLDTVRIDNVTDIPKVVQHLGKRIMDL